MPTKKHKLDEGKKEALVEFKTMSNDGIPCNSNFIHDKSEKNSARVIDEVEENSQTSIPATTNDDGDDKRISRVNDNQYYPPALPGCQQDDLSAQLIDIFSTSVPIIREPTEEQSDISDDKVIIYEV